MKEHLKRIIIDIKDIIDDPIDGIIYKPDEENIMRGFVLIHGPQNTPYQFGNYFFQFEFTESYPYKPPIVTYHTNNGRVRFNPNFYRNGKVCLSILNTWEGDQWSACQSVRSVLLTLQMRLNENPLLNEPGVNEIRHKYHIELYNEIITYENINLCICDYVIDIANLPNQFKIFYNDVCKLFISHYQKIHDAMYQLIETEKSKFHGSIVDRILNDVVYETKIKINYGGLLEKFERINLNEIENKIEMN